MLPEAECEQRHGGRDEEDADPGPEAEPGPSEARAEARQPLEDGVVAGGGVLYLEQRQLEAEASELEEVSE